MYAYRFDWDEEPTLLFADYGVLLGAAHGFEIPFVFGHWKLGGAGDRLFDASNEPGREALSAQMRSYWAQLAYTGDPGRGRKGDLATWTAWDDATPESPKYIVFDTEADGGVRMSYETYTKERIIAEIREDPRMPTWQRQVPGAARARDLLRPLHPRGLRRRTGLRGLRAGRVPVGGVTAELLVLARLFRRSRGLETVRPR